MLVVGLMRKLETFISKMKQTQYIITESGMIIKIKDRKLFGNTNILQI